MTTLKQPGNGRHHRHKGGAKPPPKPPKKAPSSPNQDGFVFPFVLEGVPGVLTVEAKTKTEREGVAVSYLLARDFCDWCEKELKTKEAA